MSSETNARAFQSQVQQALVAHARNRLPRTYPLPRPQVSTKEADLINKMKIQDTQAEEKLNEYKDRVTQFLSGIERLGDENLYEMNSEINVSDRLLLSGWTDVNYSCSTNLCQPGAYSDNFKWKDSSECLSFDEFKEMILVGWCVLSENKDIVRDALEASGKSDAEDDVIDLIDGNVWRKIRIGCKDLDGTARAIGFNIIYIDKKYLYQAQKRWTEAESYCHSYKFKSQMCIACDIASILLHEITHYASIAVFDSLTNYRTSYVIENYFRYWVMHRYCVLGWGCCDFSSDSDSNYENLLGEPEFKDPKHYTTDDGVGYWIIDEDPDLNKEGSRSIYRCLKDDEWGSDFEKTCVEDENTSDDTRHEKMNPHEPDDIETPEREEKDEYDDY